MTQSIRQLHKSHKISLFQHLISPYVLVYTIVLVTLAAYKGFHDLLYRKMNSLTWSFAQGSISNSLTVSNASEFSDSFNVDISSQMVNYQKSLNTYAWTVRDSNIDLISSYKTMFETFEQLHNSQLDSITNTSIADLESSQGAINITTQSVVTDLEALNDTISISVVTVGSELDLSSISDIENELILIPEKLNDSITSIQTLLEDNKWDIVSDVFQISIDKINNMTNLTIQTYNSSIFISTNLNVSLSFHDSSNRTTGSASSSTEKVSLLPSSLDLTFKKRFKTIITVISILFSILFILSLIWRHYHFKTIKPFLLDVVHDVVPTDPNLKFLIRDRTVSDSVLTWLQWLIGQYSHFSMLISVCIVTVITGVCLHSLKSSYGALSLSSSSSEITNSTSGYSTTMNSSYVLDINSSFTINNNTVSDDLNTNIQNYIEQFNSQQRTIFKDLSNAVNENSDSFKFNWNPFNLTYPEFKPSLPQTAHISTDEVSLLDQSSSTSFMENTSLIQMQGKVKGIFTGLLDVMISCIKSIFAVLIGLVFVFLIVGLVSIFVGIL